MEIQFDNASSLISFLSKKDIGGLVDKPLYLNIVLFRKNRVFTNKFDDMIYWLWKDEKNVWQMRSAYITTKPGIFYVKNPLSPLGVGILKGGFHKDSHELGYHKGEYRALVQKKPLPVWRDNDKDSWADFIKLETGVFGINIHRANARYESSVVDKWSAACQVFANPVMFSRFISQCEKHAAVHGNSFDILLVE